jgi:tRNA A-37 threonylcarbamoyl transferase component Bud32
MTAATDRTLERYEIIDRLAVGGMAEVFRAKAFGAHGFEKALAIKRILPDLASDPEFEQRFILEAKLAVQLAHANIVQVFDFGRVSGSLFIAMEYVDGLDLAALLRALHKRGERVPVGAALHIAIELCKGLDYAHQRGVVHRDVSPSNVLLSRSGEVKIADFGIAQAEREQARKRSTQRRIMGKWRYMSPEQTRGEQLTARSDLFSAAACIYEVFTGTKLFPGEDAEAVASNIAAMPIPPLRTARPELPERLDAVLARALERAPDARPRRAAELLRAFTDISYESSIVASAMDVADVVASVLGDVEHEAVVTGSGRGIDDLIKAQLGKGAAEPTQAEPDRRTEQASVQQTQTTFVRKGVDADGATMWELEGATVAAVPSAIRYGRATGSHRAVEDSGGSLATARSAVAGRWGLWGASAALAVAALGASAWLAFGHEAAPTSAPTVAAVAADAGSPLSDAATAGRLRFESVPPGAVVVVDGVALEHRTPTSAEVRGEGGHSVVFELEGYRRWRSPAPVSVGVGLTLLVQETLERERAGLRVTTRPAGASVYLDGELVGATPLDRDDLAPGAGRALRIVKDEYRDVDESLELRDGNTLVIDRVLKSAVDYGKVNVFIVPGPGGGWADVYFRGKKVAEAPVKGLRLPLGRHRLRLENPESGRATSVTVDVVSDRDNYYRVTL